jgi:hypothetical protein
VRSMLLSVLSRPVNSRTVSFRILSISSQDWRNRSEMTCLPPVGEPSRTSFPPSLWCRKVLGRNYRTIEENDQP